MAIFYLDLSILTRSKGRDAVSHAAYQSKTILLNEYNGHVQKKVTKQQLVEHEVFLPAGVPEELRNTKALWNSVELFETNINAQLCRCIVVELQDEFNHAENMIVLQKYIQTFLDDGMCVQMDVHRKSNGREHAHLMLTMRRWDTDKNRWSAKSQKQYLCRDNFGAEEYFSAEEFKERKADGWEKVFRFEKDGGLLQLTQTEAEEYPDYKRKSKDPVSKKIDLHDAWNDRRNVVRWRQTWADVNNQMFEAKGLETRIDHRSYIDQGLPFLPRESYTRSECEQLRRSIKIEKKKRNDAIDTYNETVYALYQDANEVISDMEELCTSLESNEQDEESIRIARINWECCRAIIASIIESGLFSESFCQYWAECLKELKKKISELFDYFQIQFGDGKCEEREPERKRKLGNLIHSAQEIHDAKATENDLFLQIQYEEKGER